MGESESRGSGRERGVTPVVGMALLVVIALLVAITVFVIGSGALSGVTAQADTEQAVGAMNSLSHDVQSRGYAIAELPSGGDSHVDPDAGWMRIRIGNQTVLTRNEGQLGALYYRSGDTTVAYQGGGVWRRNVGGNATIERAPPFQYATGSDPTLSLPVVSLRGANGSVAEDRLSTAETRARFPDENVSNPITEDVTITVQSEFYDAWGEFFAQRFGGGVSYDHGDRRASVTLGGGNLTQRTEYNRTVRNVGGIQGFVVNDGPRLNARQNMEIDSYDSSEAPYPTSAGSNGDIRTNGKLQLDNQMVVHGDVEATGEAIFSNRIEVEGDTILGDPNNLTTVDTGGGGGLTSRFHGLFSTKSGLRVTDGVEFGDDVIVGGELDEFEGDVDGTLYVHGDMVDDGGNAFSGTVQGDVIVGGAVDLDDSSLTVQGDVIHDPSGDQLRDPVDPVVAVPDPGVDLSAKQSSFQSNNDNDRTTYISGGFGGGFGGGGYGGSDDELQHCGAFGFGSTGCELQSGRYYLDSIDLNEEPSMYGTSEERLTLNATDGPVDVFVDGNVRVHNLGEMEVLYDPDDPHPVRFYVDGEFKVEQGGTVHVPGHRSPLLQVYVAPDEQWRIEGGSSFTGAVYGLSDGTQRTEISLSGGSGSEVYGGLVGDITQFDQEGEAHFDESLANGTIGDPNETDVDEEQLDTRRADVVYLHVDQRTVEAG